MKNQKIIVSLLFVSLLSLPLICGAAAVDPSITKAFQGVITIASAIVALICTIMIIWGGVVMLTAAGSPDKVAMGRQTIMWAVIGFVIVLIANGIMLTVKSIT